MRRNWQASLLASILVAGLVTAVVAAALTQTDRRGSANQAAAAAAIAQQQDKPDKDDVGGGPPPWAHANGQGKRLGKGHGADKVWKEAWHRLTPAQKQEKMAVLVRAHEQGMATWADCVAAGGNDASKRGTCVKPLPPGIAKKTP